MRDTELGRLDVGGVLWLAFDAQGEYLDVSADQTDVASWRRDGRVLVRVTVAAIEDSQSGPFAE